LKFFPLFLCRLPCFGLNFFHPLLYSVLFYIFGPHLLLKFISFCGPPSYAFFFQLLSKVVLTSSQKMTTTGLFFRFTNERDDPSVTIALFFELFSASLPCSPQCLRSPLHSRLFFFFYFSDRETILLLFVCLDVIPITPNP